MALSTLLGVLAVTVVVSTFYVMRSWSVWLGHAQTRRLPGGWWAQAGVSGVCGGVVFLGGGGGEHAREAAPALWVAGAGPGGRRGWAGACGEAAACMAHQGRSRGAGRPAASAPRAACRRPGLHAAARGRGPLPRRHQGAAGHRVPAQLSAPQAERRRTRAPAAAAAGGAPAAAAGAGASGGGAGGAGLDSGGGERPALPDRQCLGRQLPGLPAQPQRRLSEPPSRLSPVAPFLPPPACRLPSPLLHALLAPARLLGPGCMSQALGRIRWAPDLACQPGPLLPTGFPGGGGGAGLTPPLPPLPFRWPATMATALRARTARSRRAAVAARREG